MRTANDANPRIDCSNGRWVGDKNPVGKDYLIADQGINNFSFLKSLPIHYE